MQRDARAFLWDVIDAAQAIQSFVSGLDAAGYASSALVNSAVERKFEIIGEALNQLSKREPALAVRIPELGQIVAFRNQLIHGYALVNHRRVWVVIQDALPGLLSCVQGLLEELGEA
ncbi:DUF86 domain-containing protein [Roseateles sp.]|uniref:HepT-like ribonuclease domain-containing protein n=1 Tax=Roseateles sp. TaxID=1971397 RepID=UPI003BA800AA